MYSISVVVTEDGRLSLQLVKDDPGITEKIEGGIPCAELDGTGNRMTVLDLNDEGTLSHRVIVIEN